MKVGYIIAWKVERVVMEVYANFRVKMFDSFENTWLCKNSNGDSKQFLSKNLYSQYENAMKVGYVIA